MSTTKRRLLILLAAGLVAALTMGTFLPHRRAAFRVAAGPLFTSGYETGDFSEWTGETDTQSNLSVQSTVKRSGTYASMYEMDNVTVAYSYVDLASSRSEFYATVWLQLNDVTAVDDASGAFSFLTVRDDSPGDLVIVRALTAGADPRDVTRMAAIYYNDAGAQFAANVNAAWVAGTWHRITLYWKSASAAGANDGIFKTWFDGSLMHNLTTVDSDTKTGAKTVRVGNLGCEWLTNQGIYAYMDDVTVDAGEPTTP